MTNKTFKPGDKAYHRLRGEWVSLINNDYDKVVYLLVDAEAHNIYTIDGKSHADDKYPVLLDHEPEEHKWKPKQGDLCWFWDESTEDGLYVDRFDEMSDEILYKDKDGILWTNCAPFEGSLPKGVEL